MATCEIPGWGYSLRYDYGIFRQIIAPDGSQLEVPDPWLDHSNPWEIVRLDAAVEIRLYGQAERPADGKGPGKWTGGQVILAVPHDVPIPGYGTQNTNNLRLWSAKPKRAFDFASFNAGNYEAATREVRPGSLLSFWLLDKSLSVRPRRNRQRRSRLSPASFIPTRIPSKVRPRLPHDLS